MGLTLQFILNGLIVGSAYALIAMGLTMIFGLMDIANFAHGEFYMLGGFFAYTFAMLVGLNFFLSVVIAILLTLVCGAFLDKVAFKKLRGKPLLSTTLATIGLSIFLQNAALLIWGPKALEIKTPFPLDPVRIGPLVITELRLFIAAVTFSIIILAHLVLYHTKIGRAVRATFQNKESAALVGIDIERINFLTFTFGAVIAAIAGMLLSTLFLIYPTVGGFATLKAFIIVIVGGMGSFIGAIVTGLMLGVAESLGAGYISSAYKDVIGFIIVIVVLMFMPQGLFGKTVASK